MTTPLLQCLSSHSGLPKRGDGCPVGWLCYKGLYTHTQIQVCSNPLIVDKTKYALSVAAEVITFYETEFDIPYPLPKQGVSSYMYIATLHYPPAQARCV